MALRSALVVVLTEFGHTPRLSGSGRDHYPRAWSSVLVGGGIKGGQVIGATDKEGATVIDKQVSAIDFMATVCRILGIDYTQHFHTHGGRPMRIVDKGEKPIRELLA